MDEKELIETPLTETELAQKEQELTEKAAELKEKEKDLKQREEVVFKNAKEKLYDKIHIPVKALDVIIIACFVVIILIFLFKGNW